LKFKFPIALTISRTITTVCCKKSSSKHWDILKRPVFALSVDWGNCKLCCVMINANINLYRCFLWHHKYHMDKLCQVLYRSNYEYWLFVGCLVADNLALHLENYQLILWSMHQPIKLNDTFFGTPSIKDW